MMKPNLFAPEERGAKLSNVGDAFEVMAMAWHVGFAARAAAVDQAAPRPERESGGQMIDANIVQAPKQSLGEEEMELASESAMPITWKPAKRRQMDIDARWTKKHGKSYFGYEISVNADERYKPVRKFKVSSASEHPTRAISMVIGKTGYPSAYTYPAQGFERQAEFGNPTTANHRVAKVRALVENVFAGLAQHTVARLWLDRPEKGLESLPLSPGGTHSQTIQFPGSANFNGNSRCPTIKDRSCERSDATI